MREQVPQFIELEPKIIGPLTLKQSLYLAGAAGIVFILWMLHLDFFVFLILTTLIAISALALAFLKINNQPLSHILKSMLFFLVKSKVFVWKKTPHKKPPLFKKEEIKLVLPPKTLAVKKGTSKLQQLSRKIDLGS